MNPLACLTQIRYLTWQDRIAYLAHKGQDGALPPPVVEHRFEDIWYVRTVRLPAGSWLVGRPHKEGHITKLIFGSVMLAHELGQRYYEAPTTLQTIAGYQFVILARTDVVAETWHLNPDGIKDVGILEDLFFAPAEPVLDRGRVVAEYIALNELPPEYQRTLKDSA